jgi:putative DNA primase/helicase
MSERFADAARSRGLLIQTPIADGVVHRVRTSDKSRSLNGAYVLFANGRGWFQNHADGMGRQEYAPESKGGLTAAERYEARVRVAEERKRFQEARTEEYRAAALEAKGLFGRGLMVKAHGYLSAKGVLPHGLRVLDGALLVPVRDANGNWQSLQRIFSNGSKTFLKGGRLEGGMFVIGNIYPEGAALVAEGYSTGATIYEATGCATVVAFNCGNLTKVARSLRKRYPKLKIIICADDDRNTRGNPGLTSASEAARAVGGYLAKPNVKKGSDFNDMCAELGMQEVRRELMAVVKGCMMAPDRGK